MALLSLCGLSSAQPSSSGATTFPTQPVRLVVLMPPGSAPDIRARHIAQKLAGEWEQAVIVDNRPGAAGNIAMEFAARAPADGHTIVLAGVQSLAVLPHLTGLGFDPLNDFVAVSRVSAAPMVLVAHSGAPFSSVSELVLYARAHPRKLNSASTGTGGLAHLAIMLFNKSADVDITHIPYKGGTQTTADLIGGQVQLMFDFALVVGPHVKAGRLKALAVASDRRLGVLPEVPTFEELGYAGMQITGWQGILVPAGTPPEIVSKLNRALVKVLSLPDVREAIVSTGGEVGGDSTEQFTAFIRAEHARWGKVIAEAGIRLE